MKKTLLFLTCLFCACINSYAQKMAFTEHEFLVNDTPVRIKGVNYRTSHLKAGSNVSWQKKYLQDIKELKRHHVNAIHLRDSVRPVFYDLCSQYDMYVLNEAAGYDPAHPLVQEGCLWDWPNHDLPVKMVEMQKKYQDIRFFNFNREAGSLSVQNLHPFRSLSDFDFYYVVLDHGKEVHRAPLTGVNAAPGETQVINGLKGYSLQHQTVGDVRIEFYAVTRKDEPLFPKGSVVACNQTYIHTFYRPAATPQTDPVLIDKVVQTADRITLSGKDLYLSFSCATGQLVSYRYLGEEYLYGQQGPRPFFWRAPTVNDFAAGLPKLLKPWKDASYQPLQVKDFSFMHGRDTTATLQVTYLYPEVDAVWKVVYKIYPNGVLKVDNYFESQDTRTPMIPRVGLRMQFNSQLTQVTYFGRGPRANYRDCRSAQFIKAYTSHVDETGEMTASPQENNHRTDIYWCTLSGGLQGGLLFVADRTFEMNVSRTTLEDLERHTHTRKGQQVDFFAEFRMMGVGADNRFGTPVQEPFLVRPGSQNAVHYGFSIIPFVKGVNPETLIRKYE